MNLNSNSFFVMLSTLMCAKKLTFANRCDRSQVDQVLSAETHRKGVAVSKSARERPARGGVKPGLETMQAIMRKREGIEPRQTSNFRGGRASMRQRRQHPSRWRWAPPGSETMACMEGKRRNLGDLYSVASTAVEPGRQSPKQGLKAKFRDIPFTEVRCFHSSEEAG